MNMTAHDQMRAMLDQLMGTARNGEKTKKKLQHPKKKLMTKYKYFFVLGEPTNAIKFNDSRVCKSFLVGCCPHDILATTVSTLILRKECHKR